MADSNNSRGTATTSINETTIKLRASCDACNAAKVRCNKAKSDCSRCERLGVTCIYGLSRRSHKSAPRIGDTSPLASSSSSSEQHAINDNAQPPSCPIPLGVDQLLFDDSTATFMSILSNDTIEMDNILDWTLDTSSNLSSGPASVGLGHSQESPGGTTTCNLGLHESSISSKTNSYPDLLDGALQCSCTGDLLKELASMVSVGTPEDQAIFWEVHISNLRHAINISESCINCSCMYRDELSIVTISVLVGRVLQGFETVLSRAWTPVHPATTSDGIVTTGGRHASTTSPHGSAALSWGMLQIEPDEEHDMKQHLLLLQFRKLLRVLEHLRNSFHQLRARQGNSGNDAHLMACHFMHTWLTQRAGIVKEKYFASGGC